MHLTDTILCSLIGLHSLLFGKWDVSEPGVKSFHPEEAQPLTASD